MREKLFAMVVMGAILMTSGCNFSKTNAVEQNTPAPDTEPVKTQEAEKPEEKETVKITASDEMFDSDMWETVGECEADVDGDGEDDTIRLCISDKRDEDGNILWEDMQEWALFAEGANGLYKLAHESLNNGRMYMNVMDDYENEEKVISLFVMDSTLNEVREYRFDNDGFYEKTVYSSSDYSNDLSSVYSSVPDYE